MIRQTTVTAFSATVAARSGCTSGKALPLQPGLTVLSEDLRCVGFHGGADKRIPKKFVCFDCRVQADENWDLIMVHDLHPQMMARYRDLALFR